MTAGARLPLATHEQDPSPEGFRIITVETFWVAGVAGSGPFAAAATTAGQWVAELWAAARDRAPALPASLDRSRWVCPHAGRATDFTYYIGLASPVDVADLPPRTVCIELPGGALATGAVRGQTQVQPVYTALHRWLHGQGWEEEPRRLSVEIYPAARADAEPAPEDLAFEIWLPVRPRAVAAATVVGLGCVYLAVTDVLAATRWYAGLFDLEVSPNTPPRPGMTHAILTSPAGGPGLFLVGCAQRPAPLVRLDGLEMLTVCLLVRDLEALAARLRARGVRLEADAPLDRGSCGLTLRCYDPDGNKLELVQPA